MVNVKDMYDYSVENNLKLLSNYSANFWTYYNNNHNYFDSFFSIFLPMIPYYFLLHLKEYRYL